MVAKGKNVITRHAATFISIRGQEPFFKCLQMELDSFDCTCLI